MSQDRKDRSEHFEDFPRIEDEARQTPLLASAASEEPESAFRIGYNRTLREFAWALARGYSPTERQLVVALTQTMRVYTAARVGKHIGGQSADTLRGRADALRMLIRQGAAARPRLNDITDNADLDDL